MFGFARQHSACGSTAPPRCICSDLPGPTACAMTPMSTSLSRGYRQRSFFAPWQRPPASSAARSISWPWNATRCWRNNCSTQGISNVSREALEKRLAYRGERIRSNLASIRSCLPLQRDGRGVEGDQRSLQRAGTRIAILTQGLASADVDGHERPTSRSHRVTSRRVACPACLPSLLTQRHGIGSGLVAHAATARNVGCRRRTIPCGALRVRRWKVIQHRPGRAV